MVDHETYQSAVRLWVGSGSKTDAARLRSYAAKRWPGAEPPGRPEILALWVLSISFQDGYAIAPPRTGEVTT